MTDMFTGMPVWWVGSNPMNVPTLAQQEANYQNDINARLSQSATNTVNANNQLAQQTFDQGQQNFWNWSDNATKLNAAYVAANLAIGNAQPVGTYNGNALSPFATGVKPIEHLGGTTGLQPFNPGSYLVSNPDVFKTGTDPWQHYNEYGIGEGREGAWGNTTFDMSNYLANNPDVWQAGADPIQHWLMSGYDEGRQGGFGGPDFNEQNYLANNPDVFRAGADPIQHWLQYGQNENRTGGWGENDFNEQAYSQHNPDVAAAGMDPTAHWMQFGSQEGRQGGWGDDPFNPQEYLLQNRDVAAAGADPLQHWMNFGYNEGRDVAFGGTEADDWTKYLSGANTGRDQLAAEYFLANQDVFNAAQASGQDPTAFGLEHLMSFGQDENRRFFDEQGYLEQNPDVAAAGMDPTAHWFDFGQNEGRAMPTGGFDPTSYYLANPDVANSDMEAMQHYMTYGQNEGRSGGWEWGSRNKGTYGMLASSPAMEGFDAKLAAQRASYVDALRNDPAKLRAMANIVYRELKGDSAGRTGITEAMLNRYFSRQLDPLNPNYYPQRKAEYNAQAARELDSNPELLAQVYRDMDRAFAGSNVSNYATDWASGDYARDYSRPYQSATWTSPANEEFFRKDINNTNTGAGAAQQIQDWYKGMTGYVPTPTPRP